MKESKELQEIAKKDPKKITKKDIVKILKAYHKRAHHTENPGYSVDIDSVASGIFLGKEEDPEGFIEDIKIFTALASGKYTPGKGALKKKYATNPYFPTR